MLLSIKYKSGAIRTVNLTEDFFTFYEISIFHRANDFAFMHGLDPYIITVTRGNEVVYEKTYYSNSPDAVKKEPKIDEKEIKKHLRKQFKNIPFKEKLILHG